MASATWGSLNSAAMERRNPGWDADIAIAHDQDVVARFGDHSFQAVDLGIGIRRLAGDHQPCGASGEFSINARTTLAAGSAESLTPNRSSYSGWSCSKKLRRLVSRPSSTPDSGLITLTGAARAVGRDFLRQVIAGGDHYQQAVNQRSGQQEATAIARANIRAYSVRALDSISFGFRPGIRRPLALPDRRVCGCARRRCRSAASRSPTTSM